MRRAFSLLSVLVTISIIIAAFLLLAPPVGPPSLAWGVDVGDTFQYRITIRSLGAGAPGAYVDTRYPPVDGIPSLNGTTVNITITSLPNVTSVFNSSLFTSIVLLSSKVSCVLANGTAFPTSSAETAAVSAISGCILPLGSWSFIDSLYPDTNPSWVSGKELVASKQNPDYFHIEWEWYGAIDSKGGWSGHVRFTDGVSSLVLWNYHHGEGYVTMEFTLLI